MSAAGRQRANQSFRHAVRSAAALRWQVLKTTLMPAVPAGRPSAAIGAEARPFLARRNDPLAADLFGVQNSHARSRSPSRFPLHKLEATLPELPGKSAAEYEADPIYFIRCAWVEFCQNPPRKRNRNECASTPHTTILFTLVSCRGNQKARCEFSIPETTRKTHGRDGVLLHQIAFTVRGRRTTCSGFRHLNTG